MLFGMSMPIDFHWLNCWNHPLPHSSNKIYYIINHLRHQRIATKTTSAITSLQSIQEYNHHILNMNNNQNQLIRFSAPWCQVCRTANVAYERMVAKLTKRNSNNVAFYSVSIDGQDSKKALKDYLEVVTVPTCIVYHPAVGIVGRITLNRGNLNEL